MAGGRALPREVVAAGEVVAGEEVVVGGEVVARGEVAAAGGEAVTPVEVAAAGGEVVARGDVVAGEGAVVGEEAVAVGLLVDGAGRGRAGDALNWLSSTSIGTVLGSARARHSSTANTGCQGCTRQRQCHTYCSRCGQT